MRSVVKVEVPSWRWGERFDPRVVRAVTDAADAANEQSQAMAEARVAADRAEAVYERLSREGAVSEPRRLAGADALYQATSDFVEQVARIYVREALYLAWLSSSLLAQLHGEGSAASLKLPGESCPRPSQLYRDASLLPAPPIDLCEPEGTPVEESAAQVYARVLDCLRIARPDLTRARHIMDFDFDPARFPAEADNSVWDSGGVDLTEALHQYGHVCLWALASNGPDTHPGH